MMDNRPSMHFNDISWLFLMVASMFEVQTGSRASVNRGHGGNYKSGACWKNTKEKESLQGKMPLPTEQAINHAFCLNTAVVEKCC